MRGPSLGSPKETIQVLQRHGFTFQKKYGQNFLIDPHVLEKTVRAAGVTKEDFVLEVGPGIGTLTQYLAEQARQVTAVEIDPHLLPILEETLEGYDNVQVVQGDILKVDLGKLIAEQNGGRPIRVVANLPYYITTPIILRFFEEELPVKSMTVMVQKEVAQRMQAEPGSKAYGALSLAVQYYAHPYLAANVPPNCFIPRPKVGSAVVRLDRHPKPPVEVGDPALLFRLIRGAFNQRRKTLQNSLGNAPDLPFGKEEVEGALEALSLDPRIRGEALSLEQFAALSNRLQERALCDRT